MIWFLVLSLVPMMFVTGYSLVKYEQAIDTELVQRLRANSREFEQTLGEYQEYLKNRRNRLRADPMLSFYLLTNSLTQAKAQVRSSIHNSLLASLSLFNRDGQLIATLTQQDDGEKPGHDLENAGIYLSDAYKAQLEKAGEMTIVDVGGAGSMDLIALTRIDTKNARVAGYVEEIINLGPAFLEALKKRLGLEIILFDSKGNIVASSQPDFLLYQKDYFASTILKGPETFFDLTVRAEPFGFMTAPVQWGESTFWIGLGASKQKAKTVLRNINYAFFTMVCAIGILLILGSILATRIIVRPVYELVDAIQTMNIKDRQVEIPVSTDTELGLLMESFNEMSRKMYQAKGELQKKLKELERAYADLKDTQSRLVHSAKMASLGQMVAGIAHELNNPIGFIYSNMSHLRDYSQRLTHIIEEAEKGQENFEKAKIADDFTYISQDLPRLISSCEDGARRTRDIVLGLRSFSRLEEAKIKKVSLQEGIEDTLRLLSGETKNRVRVHTQFEPIPEVLCYASQLNQVFMNILTNAAQAIEGEGDIWVKLTHTKARGTLNPAKAIISIKDSGKGMASEVVDKIFDPFFTTKSVGQGTGLGLSISYGIVKKHGGDIQVKSEPGKGTEFVITVPIDGPPGGETAMN
jgi:two-component system NtrC family sensor kinase